MKIGEHTMGEHIRLLAPLLGFIAAVWAGRMVLYAAKAPPAEVYYCSVTAAGAISVLLAVLLVYFKRFGGYLSVITCAVLIEAWAQLLISLAIAFTILTDVPTVYTAPPFSGRMTPLQNMFSHVTFSLSFGSLFGAAMGCVLLWILRVLVPPESFQKHG